MTLKELTAFRTTALRHRGIVDLALASVIVVPHGPAPCPLHCFVLRLVTEDGIRDDLDRSICNEVELDCMQSAGWSPPSWYDDSEWGD